MQPLTCMECVKIDLVMFPVPQSTNGCYCIQNTPFLLQRIRRMQIKGNGVFKELLKILYYALFGLLKVLLGTLGICFVGVDVQFCVILCRLWEEAKVISPFCCHLPTHIVVKLSEQSYKQLLPRNDLYWSSFES